MKKELTPFLALALAGCALVSHGTEQTINVTSEPPGARAAMTCDGIVQGEAATPGTITFKRRHDVCDVRFTRDGVETRVPLVSVPARAFWGNFGIVAGAGIAIFASGAGGNLVGLIALPVTLVTAGATLLVDKLSGAYYDWTPHTVNATSGASGTSAAPPPPPGNSD